MTNDAINQMYASELTARDREVDALKAEVARLTLANKVMQEILNSKLEQDPT